MLAEINSAIKFRIANWSNETSWKHARKENEKKIYIMKLREIIMEYSWDMERDKRKEEISIHFVKIIYNYIFL